MKVAVVGANGQLGCDVCTAFAANGDTVCQLTHQDLDISSAEKVDNILGGITPDLIVNTAAMHQVDRCEADPVTAFAVNGIGARNLARFAAMSDTAIVQISTDYVFDGRKGAPYVEEDLPLPLNVYGNTKLSAEFFVRAIAPRHFVLRVSALYGPNPCRAKGGLNFIELMLKLSREREELRVVDDEFVSPTSTAEIAAQIVKLSRSDAYGLYHATAEGSCSWYEFAKAIFEKGGLDVKVKPVSSGEFPGKVPRPRYSVLENSALKKLALNVFTDWTNGLANYMVSRKTCVAG